VALRIYDSSGALVRALVAGERPAGAHVANWDGRDDAGRAVATGIYYCRLDAGGKMLTRKMLLLK
jgi:flagellar hook assembly protein FlgD